MKTIRTCVLVLLLFEGVNALIGGGLLMYDPSGDAIRLSMTWLERTSFDNFFVPGLILFIVNGVLSVVTTGLVYFKWKYQALAVIGQGCMLSGWIIIQMILLHVIYFLHLIIGGIGFALLILGIVMNEKNQVKYAGNITNINGITS